MMVTVVALLALILSPVTLFAWGDLGHRAISEAVQANLTPETVKAIAKIIGKGDELPVGTLARLSLWPDRIRPLSRNPRAFLSGFTHDEYLEAQAFVRAHPDHTEWHFVDLPPGSKHYPDLLHSDDPTDPVLPFTRPNDIVQMIQRCIDILEAETQLPEFSKLQALRWLLHLVEDLHQPLHVASGYYESDEAALPHPRIIDDPGTVTQKHAKNDRGGNVLLFLQHPQCPTKATRQNLHFIWDDCLVHVVNGEAGCKGSTTAEDVTHLTGILRAQIRQPAGQAYRTSGDHHRWAEEWATDTLEVARMHVFTVRLAEGCVIKSDKPTHDPVHAQSRIVHPRSKQEYLNSHTHAAATQLTKAAVRLASLLNQLNWR